MSAVGATVACLCDACRYVIAWDAIELVQGGEVVRDVADLRRTVERQVEHCAAGHGEPG